MLKQNYNTEQFLFSAIAIATSNAGATTATTTTDSNWKKTQIKTVAAALYTFTSHPRLGAACVADSISSVEYTITSFTFHKTAFFDTHSHGEHQLEPPHYAHNISHIPVAQDVES